jgi:hypothetical protein
MKIIFALLSLLNSSFIVECFGQKYDNTWLIGYGSPESPYRPWGTTNIIFTNGKVDTQYIPRVVEFDRASMSISDPLTGDLILYSNGCEMYGSDDKIIYNGYGINPGEIHNEWCKTEGYPKIKSGCFLPTPNKNNVEYYMIHRGYGHEAMRSNIAKLYFTLIANENNVWKVREKNRILLDQQLYDGSFEVVRHSNGVDWWILSYNFASDTSFRFLLTENGIQGPSIQYFPLSHAEVDWGANSIISPDGKKAVRIDLRSGLSIMDFNRATADFSNLRHWPFWIADEDSINNLQVTGISVSPNSRFLYISTPFHLWQFDLDNSDIGSSRILIDTFDRFKDIFYATFFLHQLAPDGKIYMNCTNGVKYMHVIHDPNLHGKACNFKQHDLNLPTYNAFTMPYFPNYRLGTDIGISKKELNHGVIQPNPAKDKLIISGVKNCVYQIINSIGQLILNTNKNEGNYTHLHAAIYRFPFARL